MMKLYVYCKNCNRGITFYSMVNDRVELSFEKGNQIDLTCRKCKVKRKYNVNMVYAKSNIILNLILFLISFFSMVYLAIFLFENYWEGSFYSVILIPSIITIPLLIFVTYMKSKNKNVREFNKYRK